ncbi:MAG: 30S ribosomal protein S6 [Patescibacteria group bacterium]
MKQYEITFLTIEELKNPAVDGPTPEIIESLSGKIVSASSLGRKQLVYKVEKQSEAYFSTIVFEISEEKVAELNRKLNLKEEILRHLIVATKKSKGALPKISKKVEEELAPEKQVKEEKVEEAKSEIEKETKVKAPKVTKTPAKPKKAVEPEIDEEERLKTLDEKLNELLKE